MTFADLVTLMQLQLFAKYVVLLLRTPQTKHQLYITTTYLSST